MTAPDYVVFGGSGFIGSHLLQRLAGMGAGNIVSVDRRAPASKIDGVDYVLADVTQGDWPDFTVTAPVIFNLAAVHTTPGHDPWEYYAANVTGAINVCRFARRVGARVIVFSSSISVYGPDEAPKDEASPPKPQSDYGRSKLMAEQIHEDWQREAADRRLIIARPAVVFGPREGGNFTRLAKLLSRGVFIFPGRRDTIKSCIYVQTLIDWMLLALSQDHRRILFNGSYARRYTIEQIVDAFGAAGLRDVRKLTIPPSVLRGMAAILRPISAATGLGIHPDRITKLMVSTNVVPSWAIAQGLTAGEDIEADLRDWAERAEGSFT
jgi:GlcNAc-P-P-Und epimerase